MAETPTQEIHSIDQSVDELREQILQKFEQSERAMDELRKMIADQGVQLAQVVGNLSRLTPATLNQGETAQTPARVENAPMPFGRTCKVEFPRFNGEDFLNWLYRCERFFEFEGIVDEWKLRLVVIHLYGKALLWHRTFLKDRGEEAGPLTWAEYVQAMHNRFGGQAYDKCGEKDYYDSDIEGQKEKQPRLHFVPSDEVQELKVIDLKIPAEENGAEVGSIEVLEPAIDDENSNCASTWAYISEVQLTDEEILELEKSEESMPLEPIEDVNESIVKVGEESVGPQIQATNCKEEVISSLKEVCGEVQHRLTEKEFIDPQPNVVNDKLRANLNTWLQTLEEKNESMILTIEEPNLKWKDRRRPINAFEEEDNNLKQMCDTCSKEFSKAMKKTVMPKELRDRDGVGKRKDGLKWNKEMIFDPGGGIFDRSLLTIKEGVDFYSINTSNGNEDFHRNIFVKCKKLTEKCVRDAKLDKSSACTVVLHGDSTWNPKLQQLCQDFIGNKELGKNNNSGEALAYGLVVQAALLGCKGNGELVRDLLLFDATLVSMPLSDYDHEEGRWAAPKTMELHEYLKPYGLFFPHDPGPDASLEANISSLIYNYYKPSMSLHICAWITIPLLWLYWIEGWSEEIHMDAESFTICLKELGLLLSRTLIGEKLGIVYDGKIKRVHNPTTDKDITEVPCSGSKGAKDIMFPAHDAFSSWSKQTDAERSRHLRKWYEMLIAHREELEQLKTFEQGKPLKEAKNFDSLNLLLWLALNIITAQRKTLKAAQEAYNEPQYSLGHDKHLKDLALFEMKRDNLTNAKGVQLNIKLTAPDLKEPMEECKDVYLESKGKGLSSDPNILLELAIKAGFDSRDSPRAVKYWNINVTAVNIHCMEFGSIGYFSGITSSVEPLRELNSSSWITLSPISTTSEVSSIQLLKHPETNVAAETTAALASASLVFKSENRTYSSMLQAEYGYCGVQGKSTLKGNFIQLPFSSPTMPWNFHSQWPKIFTISLAFWDQAIHVQMFLFSGTLGTRFLRGKQCYSPF